MNFSGNRCCFTEEFGKINYSEGEMYLNRTYFVQPLFQRFYHQIEVESVFKLNKPELFREDSIIKRALIEVVEGKKYIGAAYNCNHVIFAALKIILNQQHK